MIEGSIQNGGISSRRQQKWNEQKKLKNRMRKKIVECTLKLKKKSRICRGNKFVDERNTPRPRPRLMKRLLKCSRREVNIDYNYTVELPIKSRAIIFSWV